MADGSELDKLAAQASAIDPPADGDGAGAGAGLVATEPVESPLARNTRALCILAALLRQASTSAIVFDPPLQTLARRLPDEKLPALLEPWAAVFVHYGIDLLPSGDHPALIALITTGPALLSIAQDLTAELRARRALPVPASAPTERNPPAM